MSSKYMERLDEAELRLIDRLICPDCKGSGFLEGPHGGCSVNIKCKNPECGSMFNVSPWFCERISNASPLKSVSMGG